MRGTCVAVLVFATTIAAGQGTTGANGEPIVYLPHGGIAHDGPIKSVRGYEPSPADTPLIRHGFRVQFYLVDRHWWAMATRLSLKFRWRTPVEIEQGFGGL